jgi:bis(5'-nucleosyl)-tetraphosphatase (symmetrical)
VAHKYAIGDVQGCMESLRALLERIDYQRGRDSLWLTGDLVNRGPRSLEVLRWARAQGASVDVVLGNHDLHLLARAVGVAPRRARDTIEDVLSAPDRDDLIEWLRHRPLLVRDGELLMVHAGLLPGWTPDQAEQLARDLEAELRGPRWTALLASWRGAPGSWSHDLEPGQRRALALSAMATVRAVNAAGAMRRDFNGSPAEAPPGCVPWFDHPARRSRGARVVFGHWAALGLLLRDDVAALDTGCVWGGKLTALRLDDGAVFQQPALERGEARAAAGYSSSR